MILCDIQELLAGNGVRPQAVLTDPGSVPTIVGLVWDWVMDRNSGQLLVTKKKGFTTVMIEAFGLRTL